MSQVVDLKKYTKPENITHVMYCKQEIEQVFDCKVCGKLQVISGIVWHTKPVEDHD